MMRCKRSDVDSIQHECVPFVALAIAELTLYLRLGVRDDGRSW
jgi:hypothetical protein